MDRAVPDHDVGAANHQVGWLQLVGQPKDARIDPGIAGIEAHDAVVELVEQVEVALLIGGERLRSGDVHVFAGVDDADGIGAGAVGELAYDKIRSLRGARQCGQANRQA